MKMDTIVKCLGALFLGTMLADNAPAGQIPDANGLRTFVADAWRHDQEGKSAIVSVLERYIRIPNLSPAFDADWADKPHTDDAMELLASAAKSLLDEWAARGVPTGDVAIDIVGGRSAPETYPDGRRRTPFLVVEFPAFGGYAGDDAILLYGHMDKQPEVGTWSEGLAPQTPVLRDGKLYGRGSADDGYALFSAVTALAALRDQKAPHARAVIVIEACEESGSLDVEYYLGKLKERIGDVSLVVCLDSGAGDYGRLWLTNSLRGIVHGLLEVQVLSGATHSGTASGVVPSPFRILRTLLSRLEDENTGRIKPEFLHTAIPEAFLAGARGAADAMGGNIRADFPFLNADVREAAEDGMELLLNRTWRPQLAVTGMAGLPAPDRAANIIVPSVAAKLSIRIPPMVDAEEATKRLKRFLEDDPPYNARVEFKPESPVPGWTAPATAPWLDRAMNDASINFFGEERCVTGEGGSIGFMPMFGRAYPNAQFLITGVLGPGSNAHAEDEALDLGMAAKVTMCVAQVMGAHAVRE